MSSQSGLVAGMERHQVAVYVGALAAGGLVGRAAPGAGPGLEHAINPVLAALLYVTFLQVPAAELFRSVRAGRFLAATLVVNFVVVPLVVAAMFTFLPDDRAVRLGVLLVLLAPCIDYVIVFSGLAGGSSERLLAATPLLLLAQMLLLPVYLFLFMGPDLADVVEAGPFVEAFVVLIVIPLTLAWLTQAWAARRPAGQRAAEAMGTTMVPLMAAVLLTVVASQVPKLGDAGEPGGRGPCRAVLRALPRRDGVRGARRGPPVPPGRPRRAGDRVHGRDPQLPGRPAPRPGAAGRAGRRRRRGGHPDPGRGHRHGRLRQSRAPAAAAPGLTRTGA